ncbi:MAG: hypothetical protein AAGD38_15310 [Acidobacteriota bacterium]
METELVEGSWGDEVMQAVVGIDTDGRHADFDHWRAVSGPVLVPQAPTSVTQGLREEYLDNALPEQMARAAAEMGLSAPPPPSTRDLMHVAIAGLGAYVADGTNAARKLWDAYAEQTWPSTVQQSQVTAIAANGGSWNWSFAATAFSAVAGVDRVGAIRRLAGLCDVQLRPMKDGGVGFNGQEFGSGLYWRFTAAAVAAVLVEIGSDQTFGDEADVLRRWLATFRDWLFIHDTADGCICVGQRYPEPWWQPAIRQLGAMLDHLLGRPPRFTFGEQNHYAEAVRICRRLGELTPGRSPRSPRKAAESLQDSGMWTRIRHRVWVEDGAIETIAEGSMHGSTPPILAASRSADGQLRVAHTHPGAIRGHGGKRLGAFDVVELGSRIEAQVTLAAGQPEIWAQQGYALPGALPSRATWRADERQISSWVPTTVHRNGGEAWGVVVDRDGLRILAGEDVDLPAPPVDQGGDDPLTPRERYNRALAHARSADYLALQGDERAARAHLGRVARLVPDAWATLPLPGSVDDDT